MGVRENVTSLVPYGKGGISHLLQGEERSQQVRGPEYYLVLMVLTMVFTELSLGFVIEFDSYLLLESKEKCYGACQEREERSSRGEFKWRKRNKYKVVL